jgi:hypothetical protein
MLPPASEIWAAAPVAARSRAPAAEPIAPCSIRALLGSPAAPGEASTGHAFAACGPFQRSSCRGLTPSNARAASQIGAYALDVSSGVERAPGKKDAGKLFAFFEALRLPSRSDPLSSKEVREHSQDRHPSLRCGDGELQSQEPRRCA